MPDPGTVLTRNWLHFGRVLRGLGFDAGPVRMLAFLTTLTVIDLGRGDDLRTAVHAHFGRRRDELPILDQALAAFLGARAPAGDASASSQTAVRERGAVLSSLIRDLAIFIYKFDEHYAVTRGRRSAPSLPMGASVNWYRPLYLSRGRRSAPSLP